MNFSRAAYCKVIVFFPLIFSLICSTSKAATPMQSKEQEYFRKLLLNTRQNVTSMRTTLATKNKLEALFYTQIKKVNALPETTEPQKAHKKAARKKMEDYFLTELGPTLMKLRSEFDRKQLESTKLFTSCKITNCQNKILALIGKQNPDQKPSASELFSPEVTSTPLNRFMDRYRAIVNQHSGKSLASSTAGSASDPTSRTVTSTGLSSTAPRQMRPESAMPPKAVPNISPPAELSPAVSALKSGSSSASISAPTTPASTSTLPQPIALTDPCYQAMQKYLDDRINTPTRSPSTQKKINLFKIVNAENRAASDTIQKAGPSATVTCELFDESLTSPKYIPSQSLMRYRMAALILRYAKDKEDNPKRSIGSWFSSIFPWTLANSSLKAQQCAEQILSREVPQDTQSYLKKNVADIELRLTEALTQWETEQLNKKYEITMKEVSQVVRQAEKVSKILSRPLGEKGSPSSMVKVENEETPHLSGDEAVDTPPSFQFSASAANGCVDFTKNNYEVSLSQRGSQNGQHRNTDDASAVNIRSDDYYDTSSPKKSNKQGQSRPVSPSQGRSAR
jgi:hypothetical protein